MHWEGALSCWYSLSTRLRRCSNTKILTFGPTDDVLCLFCKIQILPETARHIYIYTKFSQANGQPIATQGAVTEAVRSNRCFVTAGTIRRFSQPKIH